MTRYHNQKGQTLVELLLALGIFAFIMTAVFALVFGGLTTGLRTEEQDYATMYAQEGLDAARSIRDRDWNVFAQNGTHGVANPGTGWSWSGTTFNEITYGARKFTREIAVEDVYRTASGDIFTGSDSVNFDYTNNADYQCEGGACPSTNIIFDAAAGTAKLNGSVRLDNSITPKELTADGNPKALYHFNATSGAEANKEGKELAIGDLGTGVADTDLKGLWHLNEGSGAIAVETSGNSNTGTLLSSLAIDPANVITGWTGNGSVNTTATLKEGAFALTLIKSSTASTDNYYDKTVTAFNSTGKKVQVWLYIKDSAALGKISQIQLWLRDAGWAFYKEWNLPATGLAVGWNLISVDPASTPSASGGTFNIASINDVRIDVDTNLATNTFVAGDIIMDYWHLNAVLPSWTTAGKFSNALSFDGVDDYVSVTDPGTSSLDLGNAFTLETWVNPSASGTNKVIVGKENSYLMAVRSGTLQYAIYTAGTWAWVNTELAVPATTWSHVAITYNGTTKIVTGYVNGVPDPTPDIDADGGSVGQNNNPFCIGMRGTSCVYAGEYFNGSIDEVAIYNAALLGAQIKEHYRRGVVEDFTNNDPNTFEANDGNSIGPVTIASNTGLNDALKFDGVDDYVSVGNVGAGIKLVEFWINNTDSDTSDGILELSDNTSYISIASGSITATGFTSPTIYVDGNSVSATLGSGWHHIAITTNTAINAASVKIGEANNNYFSGSLDEVVIWNKALTQADIWDHIGANVGYQTNSYATVKYNPNPPGTPNKDTLYIDKFKEFVEIATIPAGTSIDYQLSTDNCTTMKYWDGDSWENASGWNSVQTINRYFDQLTPSSTICLSARLNTTDANQTPVLDNVEIKYSQNRDAAATLDTHTKRVTSRVKWPSGFSFQDISLTEYLTDWMYPEFITDTETDFLEYNALSTNNIKINTDGSIELQDPLVVGQYERSEKDAGAKSQFLKVSWETVLSGGSANIAIETAPDNGGLPDSWTASTFSLTDGSGSAALDPLIHPNNHQWVRFRVNILASSPSPKINKITIQAKNLY